MVPKHKLLTLLGNKSCAQHRLELVLLRDRDMNFEQKLDDPTSMSTKHHPLLLRPIESHDQYVSC